MLQLARDGVPTDSVIVAVDVAGIARNVVDDLRVAFPEREIEARLHEAQEVRVSGDPARIHQALLNLGANACRHTSVGTPIEVVASVSTAPTGPAARHRSRIGGLPERQCHRPRSGGRGRRAGEDLPPLLSRGPLAHARSSRWRRARARGHPPDCARHRGIGHPARDSGGRRHVRTAPPGQRMTGSAAASSASSARVGEPSQSPPVRQAKAPVAVAVARHLSTPSPLTSSAR